MRIALVLIAGLFLQEAAKPDLSWNLKPGAPVRFEIDKSIVIHGKTGTVELFSKLGLVVEAGVRDGEGLLPLAFTVDRVVMRAKYAEEDASYDSDKDKEDPKHPAIHLVAGILNARFEGKASRVGSLTAMRGLDQAFEAAAAKVPALAADKEAPGRFAESFEQILQEAFAIAPGKALMKGETWESLTGLIPYGNGEAPVKVKSTLKELRPGEAVISRALEFDFSKDERNPDGKGSGSGEVTWSTERGMPLSGRWTAIVTTSRGESNATLTIKHAPRAKK